MIWSNYTMKLLHAYIDGNQIYIKTTHGEQSFSRSNPKIIDINILKKEIILITETERIIFCKDSSLDLSLLINFTITIIDQNLTYKPSQKKNLFTYDKTVNTLIQHKNILKYIEGIPEKLNQYLDSYDQFYSNSHFTHSGFLDILTYFYGAFALLGVLYQSLTKLIDLYDLKFDKSGYKETINDFRVLRSKMFIHGLDNDYLEENYISGSLSGMNMDYVLNNHLNFQYIKGGKIIKINFIEEYNKYLSIFIKIFIEVLIDNKLNNILDINWWVDDGNFLFYE